MKPRTATVALFAIATAVTGSVAIGCGSPSGPQQLEVLPSGGSVDDLGQGDLENDLTPDVDGDEAIGDDSTVDPGADSDGGTTDEAGMTADSDGGTTDDGGDTSTTDDGGDGSDDGSVDDGDGADPDSTDADGDDDPYANGDAVATTITNGAKKPHNVGFGGRWRANKVGSWMVASTTCDATPMYYGPAMASALVKNAHGQDVHLAKARPVLVQMAPGLNDGFLWVDPDLTSIAAAREKATFGQSVKAAAPYVGARGWVRADCVKSASNGAFPKKRVLHPAGDSVSVIGTVTPMQLKRNNAGSAVSCDVRARYSHSRGAGYANYTNRNAYSKGVYLTYNTPSATYKGTVRGGGVSAGYVMMTDTFNVVAKVDDKAVQKNHQKNPKGTLAVSFPSLRGAADKGADDKHPGLWAYGYVEQNGVRSWGFVYDDCLTAAAADTNVNAPSGSQNDSCGGKADGEYCSTLGGDSYICMAGQIAGGNTCPATLSCIPDGNGMKIDCE